jgi:hypothetical protein
MTNTNDNHPLIWKALPALKDGYVPRVKRRYALTKWRGAAASIVVELEKLHPNGTHAVGSACFEYQCALVNHDWIPLRDLVEWDSVTGQTDKPALDFCTGQS